MKKYFRPVSRILWCAALGCLTLSPGCDPDPAACQPYGSRAVLPGTSPSLSNCCTSDPAITGVASGFCEGTATPFPAAAGSETSIAFVTAWTDAQGTVQPSHLVVAYNGNSNGTLGWTFSKDQGRTWTQRNQSNGGNEAPGNRVANPTTPFDSFSGDPSVIALGPRGPGVLAMVTLANSLPCAGPPVPCPVPPDLVVLLVSIDGGETFAKTSVVNTGIGVGIIDQPRVTADPDDGSIWVLWRARTSWVLPFYTYVRAGRIDASGAVSWNINDVGRATFVSPMPDFQHPRINVFTRVPGSGIHTVAISGPLAAPGTSAFPTNRCVPATSVLGNSFWQVPLGVFFNVSEDSGNRWTDLVSAESMLRPFGLGCVGGVGGASPTGQLIAADNRIDLARDPVNHNYLVTRARAITDASGNFIGQQVEVWRRSTDPAATFALVKLVPVSTGNFWQWNPSIAARADGQIAVSYYEAVGSSQVAELMVIGSRDGGTTWSVPVQLSSNAPAIATDRSLGEYDEIVALPESVLSPMTRSPIPRFWPGMFYASWSNGVGQVRAAGFSPPPPAP